MTSALPKLLPQGVGHFLQHVRAGAVDTGDNEGRFTDLDRVRKERIGGTCSLRPPKLFLLLAKPLQFSLQRIKTLFDFGWRSGKAFGNAKHAFLLFDEVGLGGGSTEGFDAARTGRDGRFPQNEDEAQLSGAVHVRTSAQFGAEELATVADFNDPHIGAVLVAEERECAASDGLLIAGGSPRHTEIGTDLFVHQVLGFQERRAASVPGA